MTPALKKTILVSKTTGRRYFLIRSLTRPNGRRYYICSNNACKARVSREADLYCRTHAQKSSFLQQLGSNENTADTSIKSDQIDENDLSRLVKEESSEVTPQTMGSMSSPGELPKENGNHASSNGDETNEAMDEISKNSAMFMSPTTSSTRRVQVDEVTGARSYRDHAGRRRYLCMRTPCMTILKRQGDYFCRAHMSSDATTQIEARAGRNSKRSPTPSVTKKNPYRSPFSAPPTVATGTVMATTNTPTSANESQSDEYDTSRKNGTKRIGTHRSFRDASGKIRFLCSIPTCHSRVARQTEYYCRRHQAEYQNRPPEMNGTESAMSNGSHHYHLDAYEDEKRVEGMPIKSSASVRAVTPNLHIPSETKKRKRKSSPTTSFKSSNRIVLATTTLLEDQWSDVHAFLRQFADAQLSLNLNITHNTSHLLVDDSENRLHCTITKKIVQAAVRRQVIILSTRWLNECMRSNAFVDEHPYEIISDSHTTLRLSEQNILSADQLIFPPTYPYLYAFAIECRQCQGSINRSELTELIQLTGAQLFQLDQAVDILIVLCDTNDRNLMKIKEKYVHAPASTIKYVTSDFLLKSIIKFEVQDVEKYAL